MSPAGIATRIAHAVSWSAHARELSTAPQEAEHRDSCQGPHGHLAEIKV